MPVRTFLVEDNEHDIKLIKRSLALIANLDYVLEIFNDGEVALQTLKSAKLPDLIIIDINIPKIDGKQLLVSIKQNARTRHIPVIILTTSSIDTDIKFAYDNGANAFITKPFDLKEFICSIQAIGQFWLKFVRYDV